VTTSQATAQRPSPANAAPAPAGTGAVAQGDQRLWRWISFTPALAMMLALSVLPIVNLVITSFQDISWADGQATRSFAGFAHYKALFSATPSSSRWPPWPGRWCWPSPWR
jgi:ABC-type sugar transport system permease subunit